MREESIRKAIEKDTKERKKTAAEQMEEEYMKEREKYIREYVKLMDGLLKECISLQNPEGAEKMKKEKGRQYKGRLKYIFISYMRSGLEDGTGEYLIRLYDDICYHDEHDVEGRFKADYRIKNQKTDEEYFTKRILSEVIRAKRYEVKDFLREYLLDTYVKPMPEVVWDSIEEVRKLNSYREVEKDRELAIYYGELYGKYECKISLYTGE